MNTPTPYAGQPTVIDTAAIELDHAVNLAVTAYMNALAPELPPLTWLLYPGAGNRPRRLHGVASRNQTAVLEQWALALDLTAGHEVGKRAFSGSKSIDFEPTTIRIWCFIDTPGTSA